MRPMPVLTLTVLGRVLRSLLFFFFSSRRRHTRCLSDWSSDVCSSDLYAGRRFHPPETGGHRAETGCQFPMAAHARRAGRALRQMMAACEIAQLRDGIPKFLTIHVSHLAGLSVPRACRGFGS